MKGCDAKRFSAESSQLHATISFVHDPWEDGDKYVDVEAIRAQLRKLSDAELIREGRAARQLVTPHGRAPAGHHGKSS